MIDRKTKNFGLPLPHPENQLSEDVGRIQLAFAAVDAALYEAATTAGTALTDAARARQAADAARELAAQAQASADAARELAAQAQASADAARELAEDIPRGAHMATADTAGIVRPDGLTLTVDGEGVISLVPGAATTGGAGGAGVATATTAGVVRPDGTTITVDGYGVISLADAAGDSLGSRLFARAALARMALASILQTRRLVQ